MKTKVFISILLVVCGVYSDSYGDGILTDNFDDNAMGTIWGVAVSKYNCEESSFALSEINQRLEFSAALPPLQSEEDWNMGVEFYYSNQWWLQVNQDFAFKIDYHADAISGGDCAEVLLGIAPSTQDVEYLYLYIYLSAEYWDGVDYYYFEDEYDWDEVPRSTDNGTLYISYVTAADTLYLSYSGYGASNAWKTLPGVLKGQWGGVPIYLGFGGAAYDGATVTAGQFYLDNFVLDSGVITQTIIAVPDVVGMSQASAESAIISVGLTVGTVTTACDDSVPAGDVISQLPVAGTLVSGGSAVDLVVSLGIGITVPDVTGMSQANAESAITSVGLIVGTVTTAYDNSVPTGNVISQSPVGGQSVSCGTPVNLIISLGIASYGGIGTWNGTIYSNNPNVRNGIIFDWILRCDGTTDGSWRVTFMDDSVLSFDPSGNYTYSDCQLQFSCSGTATLTTSTGSSTSSYTLYVIGTIDGDTATGSYQIYFDDPYWPNDTGTWQVSRALGTDLSDLEMLAANWLEVTCECSNDWCDGVDFDYSSTIDFADFAMLAIHWLEGTIVEPSGIVWVSINDPGVSGHEGFNGQMSKYETTNAQYCQFLNAALASGDITVSGSTVLGANGSNSGADFVSQVYYDLAGSGLTYNGATNGGAARINYSGGVFTVDPGFENHPVTFVSWNGATAFCNYYGYRLPTEWEWQAAADYDGSYTYGCGTTITNSMANYLNSSHPDGTTVAGAFGTYGYGMCDMAGNAWEWTSTVSGSYRIIRGGSWNYNDSLCLVSYRGNFNPDSVYHSLGFRVCRDN